MESIFCPAEADHRSPWSGQGSGAKPKCPSCVFIQLSSPARTPLGCYWCQSAADVTLLPVCKNCGVPPNKGKARSAEVRAMQSLLSSHRTAVAAHIDGGLRSGSEASLDDIRESTEQRLKRMEELLEESKEEVERLTMENRKLRNGTVTEGPGLKMVVEKLEEVSRRCEETARANGQLSEENKSLRHELESHPKVSHNSGALPVDSDLLYEFAELTAKKCMDVMPLLSDIHVSDKWLNLKSMESFLSLGELGLQSSEMAALMRKVSRVGVLIAKLVGPCRAVTSFGISLKSRLVDDPSKCLKLVRDLKRIYMRVVNDVGSAELLMELLKKLESGSPAFDGTVTVIAYLSEVLPPTQLKELAEALFVFLEQPQESTPHWIAALSQVQLQWEPRHREKALVGIRSLMAAVVKMHFDHACLQLLQILNSYKHPDPEPLMTFVSRASEALQSDLPKDHVQDLIRELFDFLKMDTEAKNASELSEKALSALRVYFKGASVTREQVTLLMCIFLSLHEGRFSALEWLYGDSKTEGNVAHALKLIKELEVHKNPLDHNAEVTVKLFDSLAEATSLTPSEALTVIKAIADLCDAKDVKTESIIVTMTAVIQNPASHLFMKELAMLSEINEKKDLVWETNKLLNTVRRFPTEAVLPTARYLASMIIQLRNNGIASIVLNHGLKMVMIQKTNNLKQLLAALRPIMKAEVIAANLAVKLIDLLPRQPDELVHLLPFVADLANNLSSAPLISAETAITFCAEAILPCFFTDNTTFLIMMHAQLQAGRLSFLAELLRKSQRRLTTLDVYELCFLPNIQPECFRLFDCARQDAKTVRLEQPIKVTTSSSYAFVEDGNLISCGGFESASGAMSESYFIGCNGKVEVLANMRDPRSYHGILYFAKTRCLFVFGGSLTPDTRLKSIENMRMQDKSWRGSPSMREPRYCFNPALINSLIWLCGYGSVNIEVFDPEANEFLSSPSVTLPESHFCCTVEYEGCILVISYSYLTRYRTEGRTSLTKVDEKREYVSRTVWQNSNPRVLGNTVYFSENNTWYWINAKDGGTLKSKP